VKEYAERAGADDAAGPTYAGCEQGWISIATDAGA